MNKFLLASIESILRQKTEHFFQFEILVIINSKTITNEKVSQFFEKLKIRHYLFQEEGRSFARNKGLELSTGEFVAFVDSDVALHEYWTLNLLKEMNNHSAAQGRILPSGGDSFLTHYRYWRLSNLTQERFLNCFFQDEIIPVINTAAGLYLRKHLLEVGGFEETLSRHEDFDLSRKIFLTGGSLLYSSSAEARVYSDLTWVDYLKRSFEVGFWNFHFQHQWQENQVNFPLCWFAGEKLSFNLFLFLNACCTYLGFGWARLFSSTGKARSWHKTNLFLKTFGPRSIGEFGKFKFSQDSRVIEIEQVTYFFKSEPFYLKVPGSLSEVLLSLRKGDQKLIELLLEAQVLESDLPRHQVTK